MKIETDPNDPTVKIVIGEISPLICSPASTDTVENSCCFQWAGKLATEELTAITWREHVVLDFDVSVLENPYDVIGDTADD